MGLTCVCSAFLLNRVTITGKRKTEKKTEKSNEKNNEENLNLKWNQDQQLETAGESEKAEEVEQGAKSGKKTYSRTAMILAIFTPVAFLMDILFMVLFKLKGGDATSLVAGTAVLLMCAGAVMEFKAGSLEKVTEYVTDGFLFAIRIFAPVIVIGAFFFLVFFFIFILRLFSIVKKCEQGNYSYYFILLAMCSFCFSFFINIFSTLSIIPVIGISMPFISYGGSSLIANSILFGIIVKINATIHEEYLEDEYYENYEEEPYIDEYDYQESNYQYEEPYDNQKEYRRSRKFKNR
ncbi:FtsW/RodA/SpoVE family cell cycle protein [Gemella morbillorum]